MLSMQNVKAQMAETYYDQDNYYAKDHSPSQWAGQLADALALDGPVDRAQFGRLLRGQLPQGETLHNAAAGRRGGTDLTFSAPKSVSIMALIGNDARLIAAHQAAVAAALAEAEKLAAARSTVNGITTQETTGALLIAQFLHTTNRGTKQSLPDPQLHTHNVCINVTRKADGSFRALDNEQLFRHKMLLGSLYRAELARRCRALGYDLRQTHGDGRFELAQISREQIQQFSQRSAEIEQALAAQGLTRATATAAQKARATQQTRQAKGALDHAAVRDAWRHSAAAAGIDLHPPVPHALPPQPSPAAAATAALASSIRHLEERQAAFYERDALRYALNQAQGRFGWHDLTAALQQCAASGAIVRFDGRIASREAVAREQAILALATRGKDQVAAVAYRDAVRAALAHTPLNTGQQAAVELLLTSRDRVNLVQGHAGAGKTTLMAAVRRQAEAAGYQILGLGPTRQAAEELRQVLGKAETVAQFQASAALQAAVTDKTLVIVDEGSLVNSLQAHAILTAVEAQHARLAIIGDIQQYKAVEAGKPFAQLQSVCQTARLTEIIRQTNPELRQAVIDAAEQRMTASLARLQTDITAIRNDAARYQAIGAAYSQVPAGERHQVLILSGTNAARKAINQAVREQLHLAGCGQAVPVLVQRDLTQEEKKQLVQYAAGDVLQFHKAYKSLGVTAGEQLRVTGIGADHLVLASADGRRLHCHPNRLGGRKHTVFALETREFAVGDRLRVRENDRPAGLINGQQGQVEEVDAARQQLILRTDAGERLVIDLSRPRQLDYGYCLTGHSAQGATRTGLIYDAANDATLTREAWYVNISRAKDWVQIFTDDPQRLPQGIQRAAEKTSALELLEAARSQERKYDY